MKSLLSSSFANGASDEESAPPGIQQDPLALFTDFQWFLFEGQDTIYFTAFSRSHFDMAQLKQLVGQMVALAPQLNQGFIGARPGCPFDDAQLEAITAAEEVESFEGYPDKWMSSSADIFEHKDLPLLRIIVANRRDGPDEEGRASIIQVRAAHALLEGSDSALLVRSQSASHGIISDKGNKVPFLASARALIGAALLTAAYLVSAYLLSPPYRATHFRTLAMPRDRMRELAKRLGIGQRSLYFALVTYALYGRRELRLRENAITFSYTMLDPNRLAADDSFFRVRTLKAEVPALADFIDYVHGVDRAMARTESHYRFDFQLMINWLFTLHRRLHHIAPWIYHARFWRFSGVNDLVLTMVPPHRAMGPVAAWMIEPIYCGAYHPAANICTLCPGRKYMTLNFAMDERHIAGVDAILSLTTRLEAILESDAGKRAASPPAHSI